MEVVKQNQTLASIACNNNDTYHYSTEVFDPIIQSRNINYSQVLTVTMATTINTTAATTASRVLEAKQHMLIYDQLLVTY